MDQNSELETYKKSVESLKDLLKIQCWDGNWNSDAYMHGIANGLILAYSLFDNKRPEFLEPPKEWLSDIPTPLELEKEYK